MKITGIRKINFDDKVPVYDVINAEPHNNFLIYNKNGSYTVSHNCGLLDEVNFGKGGNVDYTKSKIMDTYRSVKRRMQSRFIVNGELQTKLFIVSSKKSDQDFIESYVETIKGRPEVMVVDEPQWVVKSHQFSNKRFKVAVGSKKLKSRILEDNEDLDALKKQGYNIIDVPLELKLDFQRDIESSLMEFAGISTSLVTKFISYDSLLNNYVDSKKNPFSNPVISLGIYDDMQIQDFMIPELVNSVSASKQIFIHIDTSLTGDRTGISAVSVVGLKQQQAYKNGEFIPIRELVFDHLFTVMIQCPSGSEISLQKNREFIYYLKYVLGWNVVCVTTDGFQSADTRQTLQQAGFNSGYLSLDKSPDAYLSFRIALNEHRISMIEIKELEDEILNLERNNMSGKIDHPVNGSKDGSDSLCGAYYNAVLHADKSMLSIVDNNESMVEVNTRIENETEEDIKNRLQNSLISNEHNIATQRTSDIIDNIINDLDYKQNEVNKKFEKEKISNLRKNLSPIENSLVSNDDLLNAMFGDDDIIVF